MIKAAINGRTPRSAHAAVPVLPREIARDVLAVASAGAFAVHFHPRGVDGTESLFANDVTAALRAVRDASPPIPVGITTGAWVMPDPATRLAEARKWEELPDFVSINFEEDGAVDLARELAPRGVGIEAGLSNELAVTRYTSSGFAGRCLRILLEPQETTLAAALATVGELERLLAPFDTSTPRLLHGAGPVVWDLVKAAAERGYATRIGFEDVLTLPDGSSAQDNAHLVAVASAVFERSARPTATPFRGLT